MKAIRDLTLTTKFLFGVGIIIILFWCIFSIFIYVNLKDTIIKQTYEKTDILFSHIQATKEYAKKVLRPKLFHVLKPDTFIREGMSVSFINKKIMAEFKKFFPDFQYRRVSINPFNPENTPNKLELQYIIKFKRDGVDKIKEIVTIDGKKYYIQARPIVVEKGCLACHGRPEDAPATLIKIYGTKGGFNKRLGEIIGVESVAIPLEGTFNEISRIVLSIFLTGVIGVFFLFVSLTYYINRVAVKPIKSVSNFFKSVVDGQMGLNARFNVKSKDEIGELAASFNQMMKYLKESQDKLRESEKKYRRIFEGSKDTILVADCDGFIQDINPSGLELFGCKSKHRLINEKTLYELFEDKRNYAQFIESMKTKGFIKDYETRLKGVDGRTVDVLITATIRLDEKNQICGYEAIIKDITDWKRIQEQMKEADRLASVGQLAAGLAHEINNPLGIVMGYTSMLIKENNHNPELKDDLEIIYRNAEACKKIVEDLLKFSRKSETKPEPADINQIIEEVVEILSYKFEEKALTVGKEFNNLPPIMVDREKIRQVFINILMNAYQAVDLYGSINIRTYSVDQKIIIEIEDNGCGIPEEVKGRIFEPFFTTKEPGEGTGLGLSVSYGIVKEHGGDIQFSSTVGKGTVFRVILPEQGEHDSEG